jgi:lysozyme
MGKNRIAKLNKMIFLAFVFALGVFITLFFLGFVRPNNPDIKDFAAHGIDVSHHQGFIDWPNVPKDMASFVYIKSTEGGDWKDTRFKENWDGASAAGLKFGAYHFFTLCRDGKTQAQNFIDSVPINENALPPAIDLEYVGNCSARPSREKFLIDLKDYVEAVKYHYGVQPIIYTTKEFYKDYLVDTDYEGYPLWLRDVWGRPDKKDYPSMIYWQYADNGRLTEINGPVDWNVRLQ